uniref:type I protein arginine methyltransferase n=1 Tax=Phaeomonas parva TaxID=124430 RepID=A0A7S1XT92_9STRA
MKNAEYVRDKVVLDVGTGTGILAIWAAKAGAKKVYAVEYTDMAKYAERLVKANKVENIVTVIKTSVEELELPEKVDIIVSEWMGYFLLRESMLDSVLVARDNHLKEDGIMMPSHATMYLAPITYEEDRSTKYQEYMSSMHEWYDFQGEMQQDYGVTVDCLTADFEKEQRHYFMLTGLWSELQPEHVRGTPQVVKHLDLRTCSLEDVKGVDMTPFAFNDLNPAGPGEPARISGFAGWFTTDFVVPGCEDIAEDGGVVVLDTSPAGGYTHWGQQVFYLPSALDVANGQGLSGEIRMMRQKENKRLYNVGMKFAVHAGDAPSFSGGEETVWELP